MRARIAALVDPGSFEEIGTFAHAFEDADSTGHAAGAIHAGDARVGGLATIGGTTVVVAADNPAVLDGTSGVVGNERLERLMNLAIGKGVPFVYLADGGRIRRSEVGGAEGLAELGAFNAFVGRQHRIPMATAVLGDTTEVGALLAGTGDLTVLVEGARFSISDRAAPVDAAKHGLVDLVVGSPDEALAAIARFIALVPSSAWAPSRRAAAASEHPRARPGPRRHGAAQAHPGLRHAPRGHPPRRSGARRAATTRRASCSSCARRSDAASSPAWPASTAGRSASSRPTRCSRPGRWTRRRATRACAC